MMTISVPWFLQSGGRGKFVTRHVENPKNSKRYGHGYEYIIDHRRRDISVRRIRLLRAGTLVLNQRHGGSQPALISEGFPVMPSPTVEKIAKSNTDASTKSGEAAETIMKSSTEAPTESGVAF